MQIVNIEEAKNNLLQLIETALSGEEVFISQSDNLSIQLVPRTIKKRQRKFGSAKGLITMSADFDQPLKDFKDYIQREWEKTSD
jgi:antitoxin (DNA-binding transcriptional repressor) of toxin-antitoxin stability system